MSRFYLIFVISASIASAILIGASWITANAEVSNLSGAAMPISSPKDDPQTELKRQQMKPRPLTVKALYLTAYSAGSAKKLDEIISLIDRTELNAVVIDIKDYSGFVLYDSKLSGVVELKTKDNRLGDVSAMIKKLHEHNIYVIARQTVFQDPILAEKKPEWAIKSKAGGVWRDRKGLSWVDPTRREVWKYNLDIAREAIEFGFDEINFDYVRFPTDGDMSNVVYTNGETKLYDVMKKFYAYLHNELKYEPARTSLDFFGFVLERHDGMSIGQRLEDAAGQVDFVSPMMYPSHYPAGHLGFVNPADHPAEVIANGFEKGLPSVVSSTTKIRPWIQAFNLGAVYDAEKIRTEIDTVEKYTDAGWMLWNARNVYTFAGLKIESSL